MLFELKPRPLDASVFLWLPRIVQFINTPRRALIWLEYVRRLDEPGCWRYTTREGWTWLEHVGH
jgi:hypothetical protein